MISYIGMLKCQIMHLPDFDHIYYRNKTKA
jgi:hypothetical protein